MFYAMKNTLLCVAVCLSLGFAGCDKDETEVVKDEVEVVKSARIHWSVNPSADYLSLADVRVSYTDAQGKRQEEIVAEAWEKTIESDTVPFYAEITVYATKKKNLSFDKEEYELREPKVFYVIDYLENGSVKNSSSFQEEKTLNVSKEHIGNWFSWEEESSTLKRQVTAKGEIVNMLGKPTPLSAQQ